MLIATNKAMTTPAATCFGHGQAPARGERAALRRNSVVVRI
jgi:hypothetical protein